MIDLSERWESLEYHEKQAAVWDSKARFVVLPCGRRSGKTELAKRRLVEAALDFTAFPNGRFMAAAPTHDQAKEIFWEDLKLLTPKAAIRRIYEGERVIVLKSGTRIQVSGMDKPQRAEGSPLDGAILDEFADMKASVWENHVRLALATRGRPGWAWLIGVPEGRNHYWKIYNDALRSMAAGSPEWFATTWKSADIMDPAELAALRANLDPQTFEQECEASFQNFSGRAYYRFDITTHAAERLTYQPNRPLIFCFDFNVDPGVAVVVQELEHPRHGAVTAVIGEVWIPKNSNTPLVCTRLINDWGPPGKHHRGEIHIYGDPSGGQRRSAAIQGPDWDLVKNYLRPVFGDQLAFHVPPGPPPQRGRINAMNSRLHSTAGKIGLLVDPIAAPHVVEDLEGVTLLEGGSGELDGKRDPMLTHLSDALGYYVFKKHPAKDRDSDSSRLDNARGLVV